MRPLLPWRVRKVISGRLPLPYHLRSIESTRDATLAISLLAAQVRKASS